MERDEETFELSEQSAHGAIHLKKRLTPEEQAAMLVGFIEVPHDLWHMTRHGTQVRYYNRAGDLHGGIVVRNPDNLAPEGVAPRYALRLQNGYYVRSRGYFAWSVQYENIARLFVRLDPAIVVLERNLTKVVADLVSNMRVLADRVDKLATRVERLEGR